MSNLVQISYGYPSPNANYGLPASRVLPSGNPQNAYTIGMGYPPNGIFTNSYPTIAEVSALPSSRMETEGLWKWKLRKIIGKSGSSARTMSPNIENRVKDMALMLTGTTFSLGALLNGFA